MSRLCVRLTGLARRDSGQDLIEYALIGGLISIAATAVMTSVGGQLSTVFGWVASSFP